jgi:choline transport protein
LYPAFSPLYIFTPFYSLYFGFAIMEISPVTEFLDDRKDEYTVSEQEMPGHTVPDRYDMQRMGKRQEFRRAFGFWATFGFTSIYIATWEYLLVSVYGGLVNGGFAGLVYEYITTTTCYFSVVLSLAEMASMAPTSGGQYHWVSEFAPPRLQRYVSYAAGWTSAMGWLVGAAGGYYIMQTLLEALIEVYLPDYTFSNWQATLVMMAFVVITVLFNTFGTPLLPLVESISLVGHVVGWIITTIVLWVLCPKNSAHDVFVSVVNSGGWSNTGLSCLVGSITVLYAQLGKPRFEKPCRCSICL